MSDTLESDIELYDTDRLTLNKVVRSLQDSIGKRREPQKWAEEVLERFEEAGFYTDVRLVELDDGAIGTAITLTGRVDEVGTVGGKEFDHDRMGHEVRSNLLGKNVQGNLNKTFVGQTGFSGTRTKSGIILPGK